MTSEVFAVDNGGCLWTSVGFCRLCSFFSSQDLGGSCLCRSSTPYTPSLCSLYPLSLKRDIGYSKKGLSRGNDDQYKTLLFLSESVILLQSKKLKTFVIIKNYYYICKCKVY